MNSHIPDIDFPINPPFYDDHSLVKPALHSAGISVNPLRFFTDNPQLSKNITNVLASIENTSNLQGEYLKQKILDEHDELQRDKADFEKQISIDRDEIARQRVELDQRHAELEQRHAELELQDLFEHAL
jgi:hypothetical protein